jgi:hypothetical protein
MAASIEKAFDDLTLDPESTTQDLIPWFNYGHTHFIIDGNTVVFRMKSKKDPNGLTWEHVEKFIQLCKDACNDVH